MVPVAGLESSIYKRSQVCVLLTTLAAYLQKGFGSKISQKLGKSGAKIRQKLVESEAKIKQFEELRINMYLLSKTIDIVIWNISIK